LRNEWKNDARLERKNEQIVTAESSYLCAKFTPPILEMKMPEKQKEKNEKMRPLPANHLSFWAQVSIC
jgi:hypothetical protein